MTKVGRHLLRLSRHMLHLGTVHHPHVCRHLKGALTVVLGLWRQICLLGHLVWGLLQAILLSIEGYEHRLLLRLLLLREGIVRPLWLHTMGDSGCRG